MSRSSIGTLSICFNNKVCPSSALLWATSTWSKIPSCDESGATAEQAINPSSRTGIRCFLAATSAPQIAACSRPPKAHKISKEEFIKLKDRLNKLTFSEKISKHDLSEDRADVIDYAMSIYEFVLNRLDVKNIRSTKWGVSDSIAVKLYHELYSNQFQIKN